MYARVGSKPHLQVLDLPENHSSLFVRSVSHNDEEKKFYNNDPKVINSI
jgi:hypothetical protein